VCAIKVMIYKVCKVIGCERELGSLSIKRQRQRPRQRKWGFCNGCRKGSSNIMWPCVDCEIPITSEIFTRVRCDDCNIQYGMGSSRERYRRKHTSVFHPLNHPDRLAIKKFIEEKTDATFTEILHGLHLTNGQLCGHIRVMRYRGVIQKSSRTGLYTLGYEE